MTRLYAHRGYSARHAENTRQAFQAALDAGADGVEADLQRCRDGTFVVLHDPTLERTSRLSGSVAGRNWNELRGTGILRLEELLELIPRGPRKLLNLELKADTISRSDLPAILRVLEDLRGPAGTHVSSFDHGLLAPFRRAGFEVGALLGEAHAERGMARLALDLARIRPQFVNAPVQSFERLGDRKARLFYRALKAAGFRLAFWTINRDEDWRRVLPFADAIITDEVEQALGWLGRPVAP